MLTSILYELDQNHKMQFIYTCCTHVSNSHAMHFFAALFFRNVNRSLCIYKETFYAGLIMVPFSFYCKKILNLKIYSISKVFFWFPALLDCNDAIIISFTTKTDLSRGCQKTLRKMSFKMKNQE